MPAAPRKPQDHKPKAGGPFTFDHDGKTYEIAPPSDALTKIPGRALRDGLIGGEEGQMRFGFLLLEAVGLPQDTLDALYDKPAPEMLQIVESWLTSADLSGATLPQS